MNLVLFKANVVLYLAGTLCYILFLIGQRKAVGKSATVLIFAGFLLHTAAIIMRYIEAGYTPVTNRFEAFSFFAWSLIGAYLVLFLKVRTYVLGSFVSPLATILVLAASLHQKEINPIAPILKGYWLPLHVVFSFVGNALFAIAFCAGIMYLIQEVQIKEKRMGAIFKRLPSLEIMDEINYICLFVGFPLLTLGILSGYLWASSLGPQWKWDPKQTWSLITWFLYAALLHQRLTAGWRGRKAAIMAIVGFCIVVFAFAGVSLLAKGQHDFNRWERSARVMEIGTAYERTADPYRTQS